MRDLDDTHAPLRIAPRQLDQVIAWHIERGWRVVWRRGDDVLLAKWPNWSDGRRNERLRRWLRLTRPDYDRWWIDVDGMLRSARCNAHGRVLGPVSVPD